MFTWRNHRLVVVLPWSKVLVSIAHLSALFLGFTTAVSLWRNGTDAASIGLVFGFFTVGFWLLRCLRHGVAQIEDGYLSVWGWLSAERSLIRSQSAMPRFSCADVRYLGAFDARFKDARFLSEDRPDWPLVAPSHQVGRLCIRGWHPGDSEQYYNLFRDSDLIRWHLMDPPSRSQSRGRLIYLNTPIPARYFWSYAIVEPKYGVIGHLDIHLVSAESQSIEIAFGLTTKARRRGIMKQALQTVLGVWVSQYGIQRIYACTFTENYPCRLLLEHLGFETVDRRLLPSSSALDWPNIATYMIQKHGVVGAAED